MSEEKVGRLGYDTENDRIEKFGEWYLVFSGLKGDKLEGVKVRIND